MASSSEFEIKNWTAKPVTVLGLSKSGVAVARYLKRHGADVFLSESVPASPANEALRKDLESLGVALEMGGHSQKCYRHAELIITSPGIPPSSQILSELLLSGKTVWSEVELAYREANQMASPVPMVAITGTNGKSTTTALISDILQSAGLTAPACGNIGMPILDILNDAQTTLEPLHALVAELSSFQLHFSPTLRAKVAVFTNLTPDHLDWHGSLEGYENDKLRLFIGKQSPDWSVINAADPFSKKIIQGTSGNLMAFSVNPSDTEAFANRIYLNEKGVIEVVREEQAPEALLNVQDLSIIGRHNYENVMAAAAACLLIGLSIERVQQACLDFKGLEHRLERVQLPESVKSSIVFYNDSKATNPESAISALKAFEPSQPVVLIAGGYDKMTPLEDFAGQIKQHAKAVVLIGNAQKRFAEAFQKAGVENIYAIGPGEQALTQAVQKALDIATQHGDLPILFSPACASFDMFKNYEERGRIFKETVRQVLESHAPV